MALFYLGRRGPVCWFRTHPNKGVCHGSVLGVAVDACLGCSGGVRRDFISEGSEGIGVAEGIDGADVLFILVEYGLYSEP